MSPCMPCLMPPTRSLTHARVPYIFQFPATSGCRITTPNRIFGEKGDLEYRDRRQKSILEYPPRPRSLYPIATRRCSRPPPPRGQGAEHGTALARRRRLPPSRVSTATCPRRAATRAPSHSAQPRVLDRT